MGERVYSYGVTTNFAVLREAESAGVEQILFGNQICLIDLVPELAKEFQWLLIGLTSQGVNSGLDSVDTA